jgi:hypothetical protein
MNFNHLLSEKERKIYCKNKSREPCKWAPVSEGHATAGSNLAIPMVCDRCNARAHIFMGIDEYRIHEKLITKEVYGE